MNPTKNDDFEFFIPNYLDWICDNSDMKMNSACRAAVTNANWNQRRGVIL